MWNRAFIAWLDLCRQVLLASLPNRCLVCHQHIRPPGSGICRPCLDACLYRTPVCLGCGKAMGVSMRYCGKCMHSMPLVVVAPCSYHQGLGRWVASLKYQAQFAALSPLVTALARRLRHLESAGLVDMPQVLVPVPLHGGRLRQRGFNQAWIIARALGRELNIPVVDTGLQRVAATRPQAGLTGKQRRRNLAGAFVLRRPFGYQRIALVDDVVTTGTTAKEIARLFQRQHIHVQVWCLARAEAPDIKP